MKKIAILFILLCCHLSLQAEIEIRTWDDLQNMQNDLDGNYILMNNLTPSSPGYSNYSTGEGFSPIGSTENHFVGSFDGQGFTIEGLYINRPELDSVGLFGYTDRNYSLPKSFITNVGLIDVDITGGYRTGGVAGRSLGSITSCFVTGSVKGTSGNSIAGGLAAQTHSIVKNCYSLATVDALYAVAGLVEFNNGTMNDCYAAGIVSGGDYLAAGLVAEPTGHGGGVVSNSFWDIQVSGQSSTGGGTGKTTFEMKDIDTFTDISTEGLDAPWDFTDTWTINGNVNQGYPYLQNSVPEPGTICILLSGGVLVFIRKKRYR